MKKTKSAPALRRLRAHPLAVRAYGERTAVQLDAGDRLMNMRSYEIGCVVYVEALRRSKGRRDTPFVVIRSETRRIPGVVTKRDAERCVVVGEFHSYVSLLVFLRDLARKAKGLRPKSPEYHDPEDADLTDEVEIPGSFRRGKVDRGW